MLRDRKHDTALGASDLLPGMRVMLHQLHKSQPVIIDRVDNFKVFYTIESNGIRCYTTHPDSGLEPYVHKCKLLGWNETNYFERIA